jgi:hypothetical protein
MNEQTAQTVSEKIEETIKAAEETVRHPVIKKIARFSFYAKGFLFIVIGILALMVAFGQKGGELADPSGALETIAEIPYGRILLIIFIVGAIAHGAWNILRGVADVDNAGNKWQGIVRRSIAVGVGIFYLCLAWTAWSILVAERSADRNGEIQRTLAAILLALPLGALLMALIGIGIIVGGLNELYSGLTGKYLESFKIRVLGDFQRRIITFLGVLSFTARALILVMMGCFFIAAAFYFNPNEAAGVDRALAILAQQSYGKILLFITAAGLLCHGILSLYEARFRRVS